jgi:hypothetical protein
MTDNEIIKALECCGSNHHTDEKYACKNCPLNGRSFDEGSCYDEVLHDLALSLINRLKAENEALISAQETLQKHIEKAKTEAIKEVVGRLQKSIISQLDISTLEQKAAYCFCLDEIDEIEAEMVGDTE